MKRYINSAFVMVLAAFLFAGCQDDDTSTSGGFGPEITEILVGPEGGTETIKVFSNENWTATSSSPWVLISPNNGTGTAECQIRVDSSLVYSMRIDTVTFSRAGEVRQMYVKQSGFGKEIAVLDKKQTKFDLPYWDVAANTKFYIDVTANVPFQVEIEGEDFLQVEKFTQDVANKAKPRTTRVPFKWQSNTRQSEKEATIKFIPLNEEDADAETTTVLVTQESGPIITPDRTGDSIVLITLSRQLGTKTVWQQETRPLDLWDGVWVNEEGRVRAIDMLILENQEQGFFPYEITYLTELDSIRVWAAYSYIGTRYEEIEIGTYIARLPKLKHLIVNASRVASLNDTLKTMSQLVTLDMGHNNFNEIPDWLTPENFPNLRHLMLNTNQRQTVYDLSNNVYDKIGLGGEFPTRLLRFDSLKTLKLNVNFYEGSLPDMQEFVAEGKVWGPTDDVDPSLYGTPKVLPVCEGFHINLNRFTGNLPDWVLNHPNLCKWDPWTLVFNQEGKDSDGRTAKFDNVPSVTELDCSN